MVVIRDAHVHVGTPGLGDIPPEAVLLILVALIVGAIFGVSFLAALAKFGYDIAKNVFNVGYQASGCLIRSIALVVFLYILYLVFARFVGG